MRKMLSDILVGLRSLATEAVSPEAWLLAVAIALSAFILVIYNNWTP